MCSKCCKYIFSGIHKRHFYKCSSVVKLNYIACTLVDYLFYHCPLSLRLNLRNTSGVTSLLESVKLITIVFFGKYSIYINRGKLWQK